MAGKPIAWTNLGAMTSETSDPGKLRVVIAGGGVASLETALALRELAPEHTDLSVIAPDAEFVYRPLAVREPFAYGPARRYPLAPIVHDAGATLHADQLAWVDRTAQIAHTEAGEQIPYDALVLALGARARARYEHALTIDDRRLDETLHGLIQDVDEGYVHSIAFVAPGRIAWPLPLYELALMTAGRAQEMGVELAVTILTPEDAPLAIFGAAASSAVGKLLEQAHIQTIGSAACEIPSSGKVVVNRADRPLQFDRIVALPELDGPAIRGVPLGEHGFIQIDAHGKVPDAGPIFAAGDATEFAVKHGGIAAQQADTVARSIAALAGAPVAPEPFDPVIRGMLLTGGKPVYLSARVTGGHGFSSEITDSPTWSPPAKIAARYLAPYLDELDRRRTPEHS
jgi:sulfide:quinone oxidoreductase